MLKFKNNLRIWPRLSFLYRENTLSVKGPTTQLFYYSWFFVITNNNKKLKFTITYAKGQATYQATKQAPKSTAIVFFQRDYGKKYFIN